MTFTHALSTNNYGPAKFIVSANAYEGTHTTIASALTSASSGDTIFIRPGTYTENLTLKAGVNLTAYQCDSSINSTSNVIILGKCTFTAAGTVTISGIQLKTNSDFFLAVTGSAASIVNLNNCYLNCSNNTGISHTSSSGSSVINIFCCNGDLGTTGIGLFTSTSGGNILCYFTHFTNSGVSTTASTVSTGIIVLDYCDMPFVFSTSSVGVINGSWSIFSATALNTTVITTAGTGSASFKFCNLGGGTASTVSAGSGTTITLENCLITGSNTNQITGAGTVVYNNLTFGNGASTKINTTSQTLDIGSAFQKIVVQTFTSSGTYTPTSGMKYCTIEVVGGGGGGGGVGATSASHMACGGGGGGGGYARKTVTAATIGTSQTVTIATAAAGGVGNNPGATGGTCSLGAIVTATGGTGGNGTGTGATGSTAGGGGGVGGSGDFNCTGSPGNNSFWSFAVGFGFSGNGGSTTLGGGAASGSVFTGSGANNGNSGQVYGGGGSGAFSGPSVSAANGGAGALGVVIVTEYI